MNDEEIIELVSMKIAHTVIEALRDSRHFDAVLNGRYSEELSRALATDIVACIGEDVRLGLNTAKTVQYNELSAERGELITIIKHARELRRRTAYEDNPAWYTWDEIADRFLKGEGVDVAKSENQRSSDSDKPDGDVVNRD